MVILTSPDSTMKKESAKSPYQNKAKTGGENANLVDSNPAAHHPPWNQSDPKVQMICLKGETHGNRCTSPSKSWGYDRRLYHNDFIRKMIWNDILSTIAVLLTISQDNMANNPVVKISPKVQPAKRHVRHQKRQSPSLVASPPWAAPALLLKKR